ncbi:MAG: DUF4350 domain-containing protein [Leeuwenhoekiella sp.]
MSKRYKIIAAVLILLITALVVLEASQPEPINWFQSYSKNDKIPFGSYIFYQELQKQGLADKIEEVNIPPFEFLEDSTVSGTYFFINNSVYFDETEAEKILEWIGKGNTLFVSATSMSSLLLDSLKLKTKYFNETKNLKKRPLVNLSNPQLHNNKPYRLNKDVGTVYFNEIDTAHTVVLGEYDFIRDNDSSTIKKPKVNFIKVPYKLGNVVLHTFPQAFTNLFMLDGKNSDYTGKILSYLPKNGIIYLDHYYKSGKIFNTSPLYIILHNKYLRWAYYILLIMAVFWVYFEGKRKQRSIPVVKPLPNQTVSFTRTIAGMYLEKKEHKQIAVHQINHFMEYLRSRFAIPTADQGIEFIDKVAAKSDIPREKVKSLIDYIILIQQKNQISENELIKLNTLIEKFKSKK